MKLTTSSLIYTLIALATAQNTTVVQAPTTTYALTPQQSCLSTCNPGDVNCQAGCVGAAHPNSAQVSATDNCVAQCVQGDGSIAASNAYNKCVAACISSNYLGSVTVAPATIATSIASNAASGTASSGATATGSGGSGSASSTATGTAAVSTVSKAAGATAGPFVGGMALLLAAVAL